MQLKAFRLTFLLLGLVLVVALIQCQVLLTSKTAIAAQITEYLWGISQDCHFPIENEMNSLDGSTHGFDDSTATCQGAFTQGKQEKYWIYNEFEEPSLSDYSTVDLQIRYYFEGWLDDTFLIQLSLDDGGSWSTLETFDENNPPAVELTTQSYTLTENLTTPALINAAQIRFLGAKEVGSPDVVAMNLDAARLVVSKQELEQAETPTPTPTVQVSVPSSTASPSGIPTTLQTSTHIPEGPHRPTETATDTGVVESPTPTGTIDFTTTPSPTGTPLPTESPLDPTATQGDRGTRTPTTPPTDLNTPSPTASSTSNSHTLTPTPLDTQPVAPTSSSTAMLTQAPTVTATASPQATEPPPEAPTPEGPVTPLDLESGSPHGGFSAFTDSCAGCHRSHTNPAPHLQAAWPEEQICYICHSLDGFANSDVQAAFTSQQNSATAYYSHPVELAAGIHILSALENAPSFFSAENRHVECLDCHDPHDAGDRESAAPILQEQVRRASGIAPLYNGSGAPSDFVWLQPAQYEYQLCFKCHSSFVSLPTYPPAGWDGMNTITDGLAKLTNVEPEQILDNRDLALEFNPNNTSYHPVMALGKNSSIPSESFVQGWSVSSLVYCSDCHSNPYAASQGSGPHGPMLHLLNERTSYITVNAGSTPLYTGQEVCFNCHRFENYVNGSSRETDTNFRRSNRNLHQAHSDEASCYMCHDSHGSEQLHLINLDASINNSQEDQLIFHVGYDGQPTNSQTFWQISPDGTEKTCFISCHNHDHTRPGQKYPNFSLDAR